MSKRIILFRHGKSDWNTNAGSDHERPLSKRGERDSITMGQFIATSGQIPDYIISSSANRARTTVEIASSEGEWDSPISISDALYCAHNNSVLEVIREVPEKYASVMLVGHDPAWSDLASHFIGGGDIQLKTASMACIDFEIVTWDEVDYGLGVLAWFLQPKLLR